jgi:two-component system, sensor histidine kinase YesM
MISFKQPKSLKVKLVLYFSLITMVPSFLISIFYYYYSSSSLKETMISNAKASQAYIIDNIDNQLKLAIKLSDWISLNKTFEKVLMNYDLDNIRTNEELMNAKSALDNTVMNSPLHQDISSIIISGKNGSDLRFGDNASLIDKTKIYDNQLFSDSIGTGKVAYFTSIIENPSEFKEDNYVIPIVRPMLHSTYGTKIGWSFIGLKESSLSGVYKELYKENKNPIYIIDSKGTCISTTDKQFIGKSLEQEEFIKPIIAKVNSDYDITDSKDNTSLIVYSKSKLTDWIIVQKISYGPLNEQKSVLLRMSIIIFCVSILITFIFSMFLSSNLTHPLKNILKRMRKVSKGNFEADYSLEGDDEMGELGRGINDLAGNIHGLLEKVKQEEKEKRNLELMVLQNQINPHFLYNTLNSIKWMATVQKADGIRDIVSALGRLLMNISKEKSEEISIRKELSLTEDYIFIQNIRYNGKIKTNYFIDDESFLDYKIVKFTLQPVVENAIFHGIEPKREAGDIKIGITEEEDCLILYIEDDGVGIEKEDIQKILNTEKKNVNKGLSGIGIKNVDERLKLFYGEEFGLSIDSVIGMYTRVNIKIPKIKDKR